MDREANPGALLRAAFVFFSTPPKEAREKREGGERCRRISPYALYATEEKRGKGTKDFKVTCNSELKLDKKRKKGEEDRAP